jgi:LysR family glycine cleavage system transcriptional activator
MAVRLPPMQALRAFEAAARAQSLTKAAQALNLTHGAISHQIKALERDLGVRLMERAGRGIRLTDAGELFASRVRTAIAELSAAVTELVARANPRQLRVSVMPSFAARWLLPRIGRFLATHPDIDLDVRASATYIDFRRDDSDLAIRYGFGEWPELDVEHLMDDRFFPVCSPRLAAGHLPQRPADLSRYTLLRSEGEFWKPWFDAAGVELPEPARGPMFNDSSHVMQAAVEGQGIALARSSLIGSDVRNGLLGRLFDIEVPATRKYYLVYPGRSANLPNLKLFRAWLLDEIAAEPLPAMSRQRGASRPRSRRNTG